MNTMGTLKVVIGGNVLARIDKTVEIMVPTEKVWPMLFWDRLPEFLEGIKEAEYTSDEKDKVGATAHIVGKSSGIEVEFDIEITEYTKNKTASWRTTGGNFTAIGYSVLKPIEMGTELTLIFDYDLPYSILGKVVDKLLVSRDMEKGFDSGLEKLKKMLERQA
jgi:uncharacterized membrane protein